MMRIVLSLCSRRRLLAAVLTLAVLGVTSWVALTCRAQLDPDVKVMLVIYQDDAKGNVIEVGRAYRDVEGPKYTEHWVLYPNYTFDQSPRAGVSIQIVAEPGQGYRSAADFLDRVPFPEGSRYVIAYCLEFDDLP